VTNGDDWLAEQIGRRLRNMREPVPTVDGPGAPPPVPGPSLVGGAIGRGLVDAQQAYRDELADLWRGVVEQLPDD
jgi:hypothetical protein